MNVSGLLKYKDKDGIVHIMRPITSKENIEGLSATLNEMTGDINSLKLAVRNKAESNAITILEENLYTQLSNKADITYVDEAIAGIDNGPGSGIVNVTATSTDGISYTGTVDGVTELTAGMAVIFTPSRSSASFNPTFNLNGLGAKNVRRRLSGIASTIASGYSVNWLYVNAPYLMIYDGDNWVIIGQNKPMVEDLYGTVGVNKGGLGRSTLTAGSYLVGNDASAVNLKTSAEVASDISQHLNLIPSATTADNGKFLQVVNGTAAWVTVPDADEIAY